MGIPARAQDWYARQSPASRRRLDAFAAGINAYARAHPELLRDDREVVLPLTGVDVLAHMQRVVHFNFLSQPGAIGGALQPRSRAGSNAWAVGPSRSASGNALLLANPHLPWSDIYLWYEAHLVAPGADVSGAALVGFPFLGIAFNDHLGWTHTVNTLDGADLYALTLEGGGYRWDGGVRAFETTREVLRVRAADGTMRADTLRRAALRARARAGRAGRKGVRLQGGGAGPA